MAESGKYVTQQVRAFFRWEARQSREPVAVPFIPVAHILNATVMRWGMHVPVCLPACVWEEYVVGIQ